MMMMMVVGVVGGWLGIDDGGGVFFVFHFTVTKPFQREYGFPQRLTSTIHS